MVVAIYNGLVTVRNNVAKSFENIDVVLQQRNDALTKLIGVVKAEYDDAATVARRSSAVNALLRYADADADAGPDAGPDAPHDEPAASRPPCAEPAATPTSRSATRSRSTRC